MSKILLSSLIAVSKPVEVSPGVFLPIRALSLNEIVQLIIDYKDAAVNLYAEAQTTTPNYPLVLAALPDLVSDIIAYGADLEDQKDTVKLLPPSIQIQLIEEIWSISVPDAKKLLGSLSKLMDQAKRLAPSQSPVQVSPSSQNT